MLAGKYLRKSLQLIEFAMYIYNISHVERVKTQEFDYKKSHVFMENISTDKASGVSNDNDLDNAINGFD